MSTLSLRSRNISFKALALRVFLMCLLVWGFGCKKSVEDLEKGWTSNLSTVDGLAANYPAFKDAIGERKAAAQALYDAAQSLDGDEKRDKLSDANGLLLKGFIGQLRNLDKSKTSLRAKLTAATTSSGDLAYLEAAKMMNAQASRILNEVDSKLKVGAKNAAGADAVLAKITKDLKTLKKQASDLAKKAKGSKVASEKAAKAKSAAEQTKANEKKPWVCEYCKSSNSAALNKCENCGASRSTPK